jgi:hypothetical protein
MSRCNYCGAVTDTFRIGCAGCELKSAELEDLQAEVERLQSLVDRCIDDQNVVDSMEHDLYKDMRESSTQWRELKADRQEVE